MLAATHLPVRLVLEDGRAAPGCPGAAQPQSVLDDNGLVPHGGGVQDHLQYSTVQYNVIIIGNAL